MPYVTTNCPHISNNGDISFVEKIIAQKERFSKCNNCDNEGPNLWLCLYPECHWVGCAETHQDHSTIHNKKFPTHSAHINLSSQRIWCYTCETEVISHYVSPTQIDLKSMGPKFSGDAPLNNDPRSDTSDMQQLLMIYGDLKNRMNPNDKLGDSPDSTDTDESKDYSGKPRGLVGLQNIGNTCYMNAALQALSNVRPLTSFFLDCNYMVSYMSRDRKPGLSFSYLNLIRDMWCRKTRGYASPCGILNGIRSVHPMFRGYHQHDTQEFLRCFMDQLHEELKEHVEVDRDVLSKLKGLGEHSTDEDETEMDGNGSSQSDAEYETCDSGVSERSSLSDEGERGIKRRYSRVSQSDKLRTKFTSRNVKKSSVEQPFTQQQRSSQNSPVKHRNKKQMKTRSIISDIFDGKLLSSVQCLTCDRISTRVETFQDLSLPIPSRDHIDMLRQGSLTPQKAGPCSDVVYVNDSGWFAWLSQIFRTFFWGPTIDLHDCLSAFFSADELKGDNMYSCEKCKKLRNGIKFSKVLELPEILCIHLKRFRHELMFSSKIGNNVSFSMKDLNMKAYLHKECISKVTTYSLISVICHHGTAGGGHYTCFALNHNADQWFEFDDQCVTQVSPETVEKCEAYVLFYKKYSPDMPQCRDKTVELLDISSRDSSDLNFYISRQWINRFNTFSEPGPIDNSDFLCSHGGVNPVRAQLVDKLSMPIPQEVWEYLYKTFGGGPACTTLYECPDCVEKYKSLQKRRIFESEIFQRLNHNSDSHTAIYALAMAWLRQWQSFVRGKETQPPGPIDNNSIIINKNGQNVLKVGSDYGQIPEELWQFFLNTYSGGPELMLHSCQRLLPPQTTIPSHSISNPNLMDQTIKLDSKSNKIYPNKHSDTISQQDTVVDHDNDSVQTERNQ